MIQSHGVKVCSPDDDATVGGLQAVRLVRERVSDFKVYPFSVPSIQSLDELEPDPKVTFRVEACGP